MSKVFLSHTSIDKPFVRKLAADLRRHGHTVWIDEAELNIGDSLIGKIREGLDDVDYVAVVLSRASMQSEWVKKEIEIASNREIEEKRVVVLPLLIENVKLPGFLKGKLYADFSDEISYEEKLKLLLRGLGGSNPILKSKENSDELAEMRRKLDEVRATVKQYKTDLDTITESNISEKSKLLREKIMQESKTNPEFGPINDTYAFQIGDTAITLGYILQVIGKMKRTGANQLESFISKNHRWGEVNRMLEAYSDMIEREKDTFEKSNRSGINKVAMIGLIISAIILLFGNNLVGRLFFSRESQILEAVLPEKKGANNVTLDYLNLSVSPDNQGLSDLDMSNLEDEESDEKLADEYLNDVNSYKFEELIRNQNFDKALRILDIAKSRTIQSNLIEIIDNRRKSILLMMEKGFDDVWFNFPSKLILTEKDGKQGLYSRDGEEIIPPIFDEIDPIPFAPLLLSSKDDKYGFLDENGKEIFPPILTNVEPYYFTPLYLIEENGKSGFINEKGEIVIELKYSGVWGREDELIIVQEGEKWGLIDTMGNEVVEIKFDTIARFNEEGIALAKLNGKNIFINKKGDEVKNPAFK